MHTREEQLKAFGRLLDIMDDLREKCPWDRKQTFDSLRQNTIEESFELATAISRHDMTEISKELGDVLLHVVFYAKMGSETGEFDIADVCNRISDKLIFRHPHVYGEAAAGLEPGQAVHAGSAEEVSHLWEQVKLREKGGNKTVLGGIPDSLPSLVKAYRIQDKVANVGFDWEKKEDVWAKVKEEIDRGNDELKQWCEDKLPNGFFLPFEAHVEYAHLMTWANDNPIFSVPAKQEFATVADAYLVSTASALGMTVVTYETSDPLCKKRVKIPDACIVLGVEYCSLNEVFHALNVVI